MLFNAILESTTTTGTGDLTTSAVTGRLRFTDFFVANATEGLADVFYYAITTQDSPPQFLEIGIGYCSAAGTLKRVAVIATWVSGTLTHYPGTPANLPAGTKNIVCTGDAAVMCGSGFPGFATANKTLTAQVGLAPSAAQTHTKDTLYYLPILVNVPMLATGLRLVCGNTAGSSPARGFHLGLYASLKSGKPGRRLEESGDITTSGSYGAKTYVFSAPRRLAPGWYWAAMVHDFAGTNPQVYGAAATATLSMSTPAGCALSGAGIGLSEALGAGWTTMPSSANATLTTVASGNNFPLIGIDF